MSVSEGSCSFSIACVCAHYKPRNLQSDLIFPWTHFANLLSCSNRVQFFDPVTIYPEYRLTSDDCQGNPAVKRRNVSKGSEVNGPL